MLFRLALICSIIGIGWMSEGEARSSSSPTSFAAYSLSRRSQQAQVGSGAGLGGADLSGTNQLVEPIVLGFFLLAVINVVLALTAPLLNKSKMSPALRFKPSPVTPRTSNGLIINAISQIVTEAVESFQAKLDTQ